MKTWKILGDISCIFLACIGVVVTCFFAYYSIFNKDITIGVNNIGDQIPVNIESIKESGTLTPTQINELENRVFMTANYYSNKKENGIELQELRYDYFTTYTLEYPDIRSSGMQYLGDYEADWKKMSYEQAQNYRDPNFYYYDTTNFITWSGDLGNLGSVGTKLNRNEELIIKIGGEPYSIKLDGQYDVKYKKGYWYTLGIPVNHTDTYYYNYRHVFACVMQAIRSNNAGTGDYYITLDLSEFFTVKEYNASSGKFEKDVTTNIIKNYAVLKFHYNDNGAISSNQSMFGLIECNRKYAYGEGESHDTTYWQERMVYNLTAKDLSLRYSEVSGGAYASLSLSMKEVFSKMGRVKINISLDLVDTHIIGFDFNAFENLEIDTVRIKGTNQTFYFLDKCLWNSKVKTIQKSSGVTFDIAENAINNTYTEVII